MTAFGSSMSQNFMHIVRSLARLICTIAFVVVGIAALQGLAIAVFILTGTLVPGERMFGDGVTPSLGNSLAFFATTAVLAACLAATRHKLGQRPRR